jgi:dUTP pyrophosphatase
MNKKDFEMQMKCFIPVNIKKMNPNAVIPFYSRKGDAGLDLTAISIDAQSNYIEYGTGLAIEIPEGHVGFLFPRSSISKYDLLQCNSVGVIDSNYRGEIKIRFKRTSELKSQLFDEKLYNIGDRIGQLIIMPYPQIEFVEVQELSTLIEGDVTPIRGEGAFGSSGQ